MPQRRTWSIVGHVLFVVVCLTIAAALGMAGAIGCGYGGTGCIQTGITVFVVSAAGLIASGYIVRFLFGCALDWYYRPDRHRPM
jgi:hypothetical protein